MLTVLLSEYEDQATSILIALLQTDDQEVREVAWRALVIASNSHTIDEASQILVSLSNQLAEPVQLNPGSFDLYQLGIDAGRIAGYLSSLPSETIRQKTRTSWKAHFNWIVEHTKPSIEALNRKLKSDGGSVSSNTPYPQLHYGLGNLYLAFDYICNTVTEKSNLVLPQNKVMADAEPLSPSCVSALDPLPAIHIIVEARENEVVEIDPRRIR